MDTFIDSFKATNLIVSVLANEGNLEDVNI